MGEIQWHFFCLNLNRPIKPCRELLTPYFYSKVPYTRL